MVIKKVQHGPVGLQAKNVNIHDLKELCSHLTCGSLREPKSHRLLNGYGHIKHSEGEKPDATPEQLAALFYLSILDMWDVVLL